MSQTFKIGQIVPSSNLTMEREIPAMLRAREAVYPERFSFHSSRMRMKHVTPEELKSMDSDSDRCALELSDADVDVMGYACLVAIMAQGNGYHRESQKRLHEVTQSNGYPTPIVSSAGALVDCLKLMNAKRISLITPYMKPLTQLVCDYIEYEGIEVHDSVSLEIPNNLEVAAQDPMNLVEIYKRLDLTGIDVLVLSACVQMPSLAAIQAVEDECGIPVISAAVATTHQILTTLGLEAKVPNCGKLLS
ncbi:maleate cis-trans isomerase family protein [Vibrio penaeicida]|uniref:Maleate isomerase n=1 Tax=Vibrio penaeicida TaxID=104609 RepID=A0AAV5NWZ5_9VIBR|nr:Asp/Glu racemase [Vibrio penaeicida]RTZ21460.1 Asp/Glu racemase [Vibrio penaeicida]GLQ75161.1 maleate isomerase [Vibrio penaeicida]